MKSWGFSHMRKQWIPGHFSLQIRGLGTRLLNIHLKNYKKSLSYQTCTCICHSVCQHACWSPVYWSQFQPPPLSDPLGFLGGEQTLSGAHGLWDAQLGHQTAQRNSINHFFTSLPFLLCHLLPPPTSSYTTYQPGDNILSSAEPAWRTQQ